MNTQIYFEIQADDPARAIRFHQAVFDWQFEPVPGLPIPYWRITTQVASGGLLARPAPTPDLGCGTNAFVCSFETDDFDTSTEQIIKLGGQIALPKFAVPGRCWQGYFIDTENNTFGLFQADPSAQ